MARVLVLKHVAAEPLGLLDPMLRERGHRIRYVNFARDPEASPGIERYQALIVLGGPMQVDDADTHPHLLTECRLIEQAMAANMPVLGICLGAQLIAHVLGASVGPCRQPEIGWYDLSPTNVTAHDPVLAPLESPRPVYQWHHWGFDCPAEAVTLAISEESGCQAFRHGDLTWGFQFHLELDERLIRRWLTLPFYRKDLAESGLKKTPEDIRADTHHCLAQSLQLADAVFGNWLQLIGEPQRRIVLGSR